MVLDFTIIIKVQVISFLIKIGSVQSIMTSVSKMKMCTPCLKLDVLMAR